MVFCIGDIVRLPDSTYDKVIGFDCGGGAVLEKTGQVGYRAVDVIGHDHGLWSDYEGGRISLFVLDND